MKLLALDTSTEHLSLAVTRMVDGVARQWLHQAAGGAQTSAALIPAIERLMAQADLRYAELDAIAFGQGPGSFTGLRTACAVAQGLGFGAGVPLLPIDTLLAVAEEARATHAPDASELRILALLDARMDEVYAARFDCHAGRWSPPQHSVLCRPEAIGLNGCHALAGNVFAHYADRLPGASEVRHWPALPTAAAMLRLAPALLQSGSAIPAAQALPHYIRDKVAKTTAERAAEKAGLGTA